MTVLTGLIRGATDSVGSITPIANRAALRALTTSTGPDSPQLVYVDGWATARDGGQGFFEYVASDTTSADNGSTIFVDASNRRWYLIWDKINFQAAWAGILRSNADNGQLMANVPFYCFCWFEAGTYQFLTYPSQAAFSCKFWRGSTTIWNCAGPIGTNSAFNLNDIAFNWLFVTPPEIQGLNYYGGGAADMATAGLSPIEGIGIVSQNSGWKGVILALGQPPVLTAAQIRSTTSYSTGKVHFEVTINVDETTQQPGFSSSAHPLTSILGHDAASLSWSPGGSIFVNNSAIASGLDAFVAGNTLAIEIDFGAQLIWICNVTTNPTKWNNSGTANPATGVGGISFSGMASATQYFATVSSFATGAKATANFGASTFARALSAGFSAYGAGVTLDPANQLRITTSNGNLTATDNDPAFLGNANYPDQYYIRPRNFSAGGGYVLVSWNNATDAFLTGLENCVLKGGYIGIYFAFGSSGGGPTGSGENFSIKSCQFSNLAQDAFQVFAGTLNITFDNTSLDYCQRMGYASSVTIMFTNAYIETYAPGTPNECFALDGWTQMIFDCTCTFNSFNTGFSAASMFAIDGTATVAQVHLNGCAFHDVAGTKQFINLDPADNIFGNLVCAAINGESMWAPAISPANLINPDYNFARGDLVCYPGSTNCVNQTAVVHSPQTHAIAMSGVASLKFSKMDVRPGEVIPMSMYDKVAAQLVSIGGSVIFKTADDITIQTYSFAPTTPISRFAYSDILAPGFVITAHDWALQKFAFRAPSGASKMTGSLDIVSAATLNPTATGGTITLSNGNLTGTSTANTAQLSRASTDGSVGTLFFCEFTATTAVSDSRVGISNSFAFTVSALGIDTNSIGYSSGGSVTTNGSGIATIAPFVSGDVIGMAVDKTNGRIWFRVNAGNWNNSGAANPVTNVGGITLAGVSFGGACSPAIGLSHTADSTTANFGASAYAHAAPAGFGNYPAPIYYVSELEMHR